MINKSKDNESLLSKMAKNPVIFISSAIFLFLIAFSVVVPLFSPWDATAPDLYAILAKPGSAHWLGTDSAGRDIFTRLAIATRYSLATATLAVLVSLSFGVISGLIAGYFGGWFESVSTWSTSIVMALPGLVVLLAAIAVIGPSMWFAMAIFGVLLSPTFFRLVYTTVRGVRNELYIDAARVSGLTDFRIIKRHILGVVRAPIIIQTAIIASIAISIQSGIEFLGLGDKDAPSWGAMLNDAFRQIYDAPLLLLWPSFAIAIVTVSLVLFANGLRDELEKSGSLNSSNPEDDMVTISLENLEGIGHKSEKHDIGQAILTITDLEVGYPSSGGSFKRVVKNINLSVNPGEIVGLIGESGSGKTQTAFSILGLLASGGKILGGSILFEGVELTKLSEKNLNNLRGAKIAYIPQEPMSNLDPSFTIGSQLIEPMVQVLKISKKAAKARAIEILSEVGIPNPELTLRKYPHEISGGQAQRILIAGAVSCNPDLIIADEPTTALDVTVQAEVLDLLRNLQQRTNTAMLFVTHNFGVVADLCDYLYVMKDGRIVEKGGVIDIFKNPLHEYTKSLLDSIIEGGPSRGEYVAPKGAQL